MSSEIETTGSVQIDWEDARLVVIGTVQVKRRQIYGEGCPCMSFDIKSDDEG